jgi:hypothetical protein
MRFTKSFSRFSYTLAILHGFFIGAVSIGIFAILIQWQDITASEKADPTTETPDKSEQITVDAPASPSTPTQFFAKQHGVFTTADGATTLLQSSPAMKSATIIITDSKYHVWSAASVVESEVKILGSTDSFVKPFKINSSACTEKSMKNLPVFLSNTDPAKFNFESTGNKDAIPKDWDANITAISTLSKDFNVIRVQLLSHYFAQNDCLKIEF